jgi:hypothetical protein
MSDGAIDRVSQYPGKKIYTITHNYQRFLPHLIVVPRGGVYLAMDWEDESSEHALLPFTFGQVMPGLQDIGLVANFGEVGDVRS